jgi:hypothetical protein
MDTRQATREIQSKGWDDASQEARGVLIGDEIERRLEGKRHSSAEMRDWLLSQRSIRTKAGQEA